MSVTTNKARILHETVKDQHTSHWDQDMLSRAELEELMGATNAAAGGDDEAVSGLQAGAANIASRAKPESD